MLNEMKIDEYLKILKSDAPAPGGGAVSALSGAQGMALTMMVANLTVGKKKYQDDEALNLAVLKEAEELIQKLEAGIEGDKQAFEKVSSAFAMPKNSDDEVTARKAAIAIAAVGAADAPLEVMRAGLRGLELTLMLIGHSNRNLVSDLYVAALNLESAVLGAKMNVDANVPFFEDETDAKAKKDEANEIALKTAELKAQILLG